MSIRQARTSDGVTSTIGFDIERVVSSPLSQYIVTTVSNGEQFSLVHCTSWIAIRSIAPLNSTFESTSQLCIDVQTMYGATFATLAPPRESPSEALLPRVSFGPVKVFQQEPEGAVYIYLFIYIYI